MKKGRMTGIIVDGLIITVMVAIQKGNNGWSHGIGTEL